MPGRRLLAARSSCPNWKFLPVTDDAIRRHLTGEDDSGAPFTMGVYPMLLKERSIEAGIRGDRELLSREREGDGYGRDSATAASVACSLVSLRISASNRRRSASVRSCIARISALKAARFASAAA